MRVHVARASQVARVVKNSLAKAGDSSDAGSIPGYGKSPEERNGNPLQYSCLGNPLDRGAWRATIHGVAKSQTQLSDSHTHTWPRGELLFPALVSRPQAYGESFSAFPVSCLLHQRPPPEGPWAGKARRLRVTVSRCTVRRNGGRQTETFFLALQPPQTGDADHAER